MWIIETEFKNRFNPSGWWFEAAFATEDDARAWLRDNGHKLDGNPETARVREESICESESYRP